MNKSQIAVLVVFANPRGTDPLRLGAEERAINQSIKLSRNRDQISLTTCHATTIHDLRRALLENEFQIIHIAGHGSDTGLSLEDELGGQYLVPQQALADLFTVYSPPLQCVVLNACLSVSQGQLISCGVPFTIAMEGSISDEAAIEFARGFYDAIGAGRSVEFAYEEGCRTVRLATSNAQFVSQIQKGMTQLTPSSKQSGSTDGDAALVKLFAMYKNNVTADIHNNLILEMYDRPRYEDICITPLVSTKDEHGNPYTVFEAHRLVQSLRSVILGEPGSGKTTALRKLCLDLLNQAPLIVVPVYISLASFGSDYAQKKLRTFWDYVNEEISLHGCQNAETLMSATGVDIFLLLDGWDEMTDENAIREAKRFLAQTSYHFIITCRPEAQRSLPALDRYEMHPLSRDRMQEFVRLRIKDPQVVNRIMTWLGHHQSMLKLAENPLNLSIMTIVFLEEKGNVGRLTRTKLYERAFDAIIRQHHREHPYDEHQIFEIERILQRMAYQTMATGEGRFFTMRELDRAAMDVLGGLPSPEMANLLAGKLGIIRDRRSGRMEFFHLWYQEFLTGHYIVDSGMDLIHELNNRKLASAFPYVIGLVPSSNESYNIMMNATLYDPFNYCRAIPEGNFSNRQIESMLKRVLDFGETSKPSIPVRVEMAQALARAGLEAIPSLRNILRDRNNSDYLRRAALEALVILPVPPSELDDLLLELLETESLGLLWHVIEQVGKRRVSAGREPLRRYIHHSDPIVVGDAIWALHEIEGTPVIDLPAAEIEALLHCLTADDRHIQGHALRTLGRLRVVSAIPSLKQHLARTDAGYRWIAPEAAALIGGREALGLINQALDDEDPRVIAAALRALLDLDQDVLPETIDKIQQYTDSTVWIAFLEQPLGNIAQTTIQKLSERKAEERPPKVLLARHCKTAWNQEHKLQGTMDLPLSPEGVAEAKRMALRLAELEITRVVTSSYRRAYETAQIYADHLGVPLYEHPGFRELDHGSWEGRSIPEMLTDPKCSYRQWLEDATCVSIPDSTESVYMAQQRCVEALRNVILKYPNETVLVVMHKHIRALLQCALKGLSLAEFGQQIDERLDPQQVPSEQIERLYQVIKQ